MNGKGVRILVVLVCYFFCIGLPLAGETTGATGSYTALANYRTALRCYQLSAEYVARAEWKNALSQAELGLAYDGSVSDLWFIVARGSYQLGKNFAEVLPPLRQAIELDNWVDYNKGEAILFYAELLCNVGESQRALELLEAGDLFPSPTREYLKALCHYRIGTEESYRQARNLVSDGARLYPADIRFPQVFFRYELGDDFGYDPEALELGQLLSRRFEEIDSHPPELYMAASVFSSEEMGRRMLLACNAAGKRHPLYAVLALKAGILSESKAYEYLCSFASNSISLKILENFAALLTEEEVKAALTAFLGGFQGLLTHDVTGDRCDDIFIQYERGRPSSIRFDRNQDGVADWIMRCDFGAPVELEFPENGGMLRYGTYPYISSMQFQAMDFKFMDSAIDWTPVSLSLYEPLAMALSGGQFFVPLVNEGEQSPFLDMKRFVQAAFSVTYAVSERNGARISLSILDGQVQSAQYFEGEALYAQLVCEAGVPKTRNVDLDGDGWFELTQNFGFSPDNYLSYVSLEESADLYERLFGDLFFPKGLFIRQALLDYNSDMEFDFAQEYTSNRDVISVWGNPFSDGWSAQYILEGDRPNSRALFRLPESSEIITVFLEDKVPVRVSVDTGQGEPAMSLAVVPIGDVYWLGEAGSPELSAYLKETVDEAGEQGRSFVASMTVGEASQEGESHQMEERFSAVKISDFYFGVLLDE